MIDIQEFAARHGIATEYIDVTGKRVMIKPQSQLAALGAMGYAIHDPRLLEKEALAEEWEEWNMYTWIFVYSSAQHEFNF